MAPNMSATISPAKRVINTGYVTPPISQELDWLLRFIGLSFSPLFIYMNLKTRGFTVVYDSEWAMGPYYAYRGRQCVSLWCDVNMVRKKAQMVKSMELEILEAL